jgi:hypothetical protein
MSEALFDSWLPDWRPDETLYSWCARYHRVAGGMRASQTSLQLFGHPRAGLAHDLGGRLTHFVDRTGGRLGSASDLLLKHTVLGYYMAFRSQAERELWVARLAAGTQGAIKSQLGWLATRMGAAHPLKACGACEAEDIEEGRGPHWRREHQLPGVWICRKHQCTLWVTPIRANGLMRTMWLLPDDIPAHQRVEIARQPLDENGCSLWTTVAAVTHGLMEAAATEPIRLDALARTLLSGLQDRQLATTSGRLHPKRLVDEYLEFVAPLSSGPEAEAICVGRSAADTVWRRMLQGRLLHPVRYVLACAWLCGRWPEDAMEELQDSVASAGEAADTTSKSNRGCRLSHQRESFRQLIRQGSSPTAAGRQVGVDTSTALLWTASDGEAVKRKPKTLDAKSRARLIKLLAAGKPKQALAEQSGLSVVTITRVLLSTPGLKAARDQVIARKRQRRARQRMESLSAKRPALGLADIRKRAPAEYAWLYRNDRDWLVAFTSKLPLMSARQNPRVDWSARDRQFALEVKTAADSHLLHATRSDPFMRMTDFARLVPGLYTKLRHLDRMPETALALRSASARLAELRANKFGGMKRSKTD